MIWNKGNILRFYWRIVNNEFINNVDCFIEIRRISDNYFFDFSTNLFSNNENSNSKKHLMQLKNNTYYYYWDSEFKNIPEKYMIYFTTTIDNSLIAEIEYHEIKENDHIDLENRLNTIEDLINLINSKTIEMPNNLSNEMYIINNKLNKISSDTNDLQGNISNKIDSILKYTKKMYVTDDGLKEVHKKNDKEYYTLFRDKNGSINSVYHYYVNSKNIEIKEKVEYIP